MKKLKVQIEIYVKSDEDDEDMLKQDIYAHLQELMEDESLDFEVMHEDDDDEEDGNEF